MNLHQARELLDLVIDSMRARLAPIDTTCERLTSEVDLLRSDVNAAQRDLAAVANRNLTLSMQVRDQGEMIERQMSERDSDRADHARITADLTQRIENLTACVASITIETSGRAKPTKCPRPLSS